MANSRVFEICERYLGRFHLAWWIADTAVSLGSGGMTGWWAHIEGWSWFLVLAASVGGFVIVFLAAAGLVCLTIWGVGVWRAYRSPIRIHITFGTGAPFEDYKHGMFKISHTIRVGIENLSRTVRLTHCELTVESISGRLSHRCPVKVKDGISLNPLAKEYIDFVSFGEVKSGVPLDDPPTILSNFPIYPLPSVGNRSYLEDLPCDLRLVATAAQSAPHNEKCRLWVDSEGHLKLERVS